MLKYCTVNSQSQKSVVNSQVLKELVKALTDSHSCD